MIKVVVNTPKGGVGKTTVATNIALLLASEDKRVWAVDLAQGALMSRYLRDSGFFGPESGNVVDTREGEPLPESFPGARDFDVLVADTDDYWRYLVDFLERPRRGWRLVAPVPPDDEIALERVPEDLRQVVTQAAISGRGVRMSIVANRVRSYDDVDRLEMALDQQGIANRLADAVLPFTRGHPKQFYAGRDFSEPLRGLLRDLDQGLK